MIYSPLELCCLVRKKQPTIVFLIETKVNEKSLEHIKLKLGSKNGIAVNSIGAREGLTLLWDENSELEIANYSSYHIHIKVMQQGSNLCWYLTGFYGNPDTCKRQDSGKLLTKIGQYVEAPWCVLGDFNEIICQDEKCGGRMRPEKQMYDCKLALKSNGIYDLGWIDMKFTWSNRHLDATLNKLRFDRAVATKYWIEKMENKRV